jgi:hypothetical protein
MFFLSLAVCLLAACATNPPAPAAAAKATPVYSIADRSYLSLCMAMSLSAHDMAEDKLQGEPADRVKAGYAGDPRGPVLVPLVDQVYGDSFTDTWDYTGGFYSDCAASIGHLSVEQSQASMPCLYPALVTAVARDAREAGIGKPQVQAQFASHADLAQAAIDAVYAPAAVPQKSVVMDDWNSCMDPLTRS